MRKKIKKLHQDSSEELLRKEIANELEDALGSIIRQKLLGTIAHPVPKT